MVSRRRSRASAWVFWLVFLVLPARVFCHQGAETAREPGPEQEIVDRIVAILDREVITLSEAEQASAMAALRRAEQSQGAPGERDGPGLAEVVERLIETRLVEREVERFSPGPVPEELVDEALERIRQSFPSEEAFVAARERSGLRDEELRAQLRRQLAVNRYLEQRFRALVAVTPDEVEAYFHDELLPALPGPSAVTLPDVSDRIRAILGERKFNRRVESFLERLKSGARIRRYVW